MLKSIEIDLKAIKDNALAIKKIIGSNTRLLAVVKSDAYGHGITETTKILNPVADFFGVDNAEEALKIRSISRKPILIFGPVERDQLNRLSNEIRISVYSQEFLEDILSLRRKFKIHLKVDTGMHRLGVEPTEALNSSRQIVTARHLELEGLWSHFAISGEDKGRAYSLAQIKKFNYLKEKIKPRLSHLANSAGTLNYPQSRLDLIRCGIMLYGYFPSPETKEKFKNKLTLKPALTFKTKLVQIRSLKKGERLGYGLTYRLKKDSLIGVLPIGYKDGYARHLSNRGEVLVKGERCPIIGRICMRTMMVDLTKISRTRVNEEAVLIGRQEDGRIEADRLADQINTIPYEILSRLDPEIKRSYG